MTAMRNLDSVNREAAEFYFRQSALPAPKPIDQVQMYLAPKDAPIRLQHCTCDAYRFPHRKSDCGAAWLRGSVTPGRT